MTFLSPWALWLAGLGALIAVVYFLKRQAQPHPVSALFLWRGVERQPKSALRFRWTQLLGLLLQLMALAALVIGLAQPVIQTQAGGVKSLAIVLDGSAGMRARVSPDGPTRYERAIEGALAVARANPAAEITVISAQARSTVLAPPTRDHAQIERVLRAFRPTFQGDAEPGDLISLLGSQATAGFEQVVLFTDHPPVYDLRALGWDVRVIQVDHEAPNPAITRFAARRQPGGDGYALFLELWNGGSETQITRLQVLAGGRLLEDREVELAPRIATPITLYDSGPSPVSFVARLRPPLGVEETEIAAWDAWPDDNVRYATLPQPRPWKALWIGEPDLYIERFLRRTGLAELTVRPALDETLDLGEYDWVVFGSSSAVPSTTLPASGRFFLLNTSLEPWVRTGDVVDVPTQTIRATADHPLLAGLDPTAWRTVRLRDVRVDPGGTVLLRAGRSPVLYLYETTGLRIVYFGVELRSSNLWLSVDYPILLYRLFSWLSPPKERETQLVIGEELPWTRPQGAARVRGPDGQACTLNSRDSEGCGFLAEPGFYEIESTSGDRVIYAANVPESESRWETAVGPSQPDRPAVSRAGLATGGRELRAARPLWPPFLLAGALVLLAELLYYDRSFRSLRATWRGTARRRLRNRGRRSQA
jgi:hypothetical protein